MIKKIKELNSDLSHLPAAKQDELKTVREIILAKVPAELIILFGSYARGEWVEDYQEKYEYVSDFDILIITKDRKTAKRSKTWRDLEAQLRDHPKLTKTNIIHHSIGFVNNKLEKNSYFFLDILKEGILLYDSGNYQLAEPKELNPAERKAKAQEEFEHWFEGANNFLDLFETAFEKGKQKEAAFLLHQATERYYAAILLVFTDYKPRTHDIEDLGNQAGKLHPGFLRVFPTKTEEEKRRFELLKKSYIDARYTKNFKIEKAELNYLSGRVNILKELTERICKEKIQSFIKD